MLRLRIFMLLFCAALAIPSGYLVRYTYKSMEQEEVAELRYFAGSLFAHMEEELSGLLEKEEARPIDAYSHDFQGDTGMRPSPISPPPEAPYILGYLQNNPDGSFLTPHARPDNAHGEFPSTLRQRLEQLEEINRIFNEKRTAFPEESPPDNGNADVAFSKAKARSFGETVPVAPGEAAPAGGKANAVATGTKQPNTGKRAVVISGKKQDGAHRSETVDTIGNAKVRDGGGKTGTIVSFKTPPDHNRTDAFTPGEKRPGTRKGANAALEDRLQGGGRKADSAPGITRPKLTEEVPAPPRKVLSDIGEKYFDASRSKKRKDYLGREQKRVEKLTARQAMNIAPRSRKEMAQTLKPGSTFNTEDSVTAHPGIEEEIAADAQDATAPGRTGLAEQAAESPAAPYRTGLAEQIAENPPTPYRTNISEQAAGSRPVPHTMAEGKKSSPAVTAAETFQAEVDPMQSVLIDAKRIFIFRRIVLEGQVYRQGFVVALRPFLRHLAETHFTGQPLAAFTGLSLNVVGRGEEQEILRNGAEVKEPVFLLQRTFGRPFSFISATLACDRIPASASRFPVGTMAAGATLILLMGLAAIYRSARTQVELSEKRSAFVSSVTHELKTPLTNIRMYIEMLEQGIAQTPDREQEYFRILGSESARLSRLIDNVLAFSKLEQKERRVALTEGDFTEVIGEVQAVMGEKLRQEGFTLTARQEPGLLFFYEREMMIQVLINLIENSMKFGRKAQRREITLRAVRKTGRIEIGVSDTGPGIPPKFLNRVFDDFFRVDSSLVRDTRGTGIGLALVRRCVTSMGGQVKAGNNHGPGCTITLSFPEKSNP